MKEIETQIILQNIEKVQELTQILCKVATFGMTQTPQTVKVEQLLYIFYLLSLLLTVQFLTRITAHNRNLCTGYCCLHS